MIYDCEIWSLILREERRLSVFENRVMRQIFWPKKDDNGERRKLQNEELHSLNRSPKVFRVIESRRLNRQIMQEEGREGRMGYLCILKVYLWYTIALIEYNEREGFVQSK